MEQRKITIVSTRNQKKSVIMSAATTLAELKADLRQNGIDYSGMTFYEGTSKIELKDDASVLPHDVPYKGQITNELVFMLTNANKKIRSGADMTRLNAYNAIKKHNLQEECVKRFGKNFTMCKTIDLIALVNEKSVSKKAEPAKKESGEKVSSVKAAPVAKPVSPVECVDDKARTAIFRLLEIFSDCDIVDEDEREDIERILNGDTKESSVDENRSECKSSYSSDEIDDMFDFVK